MLTDIKYLKYIKRLCWSNKVKVGSAVFMTIRFVLLFLGGANIGYGDLLSYLDACIMLFVLDSRLVIVVCWGCGTCENTHTT
jgi:hypothetical protein